MCCEVHLTPEQVQTYHKTGQWGVFRIGSRQQYPIDFFFKLPWKNSRPEVKPRHLIAFIKIPKLIVINRSSGTPGLETLFNLTEVKWPSESTS